MTSNCAACGNPAASVLVLDSSELTSRTLPPASPGRIVSCFQTRRVVVLGVAVLGGLTVTATVTLTA